MEKTLFREGKPVHISKPADRLIVAADFKPPSDLPMTAARWVENEVLKLADSLADTGVYLKVNSSLRACGYELIQRIQHRGLRVFADLKLNDIPETLDTEGLFLAELGPELLTVMCGTGIESMKALKRRLPGTEVLGVTVLTTIKEGDRTLAGFTIASRVMTSADMATEARIDGLIASPKELEYLRRSSFAYRWQDLTVNTPGIRPAWSIVEGDDQNPDRVMTPADAIRAGADRIVIGRPIVRAEDPRVAVLRTLAEIESAPVVA